MNCGIKACFNRTKFDRTTGSQDQKTQNFTRIYHKASGDNLFYKASKSRKADLPAFDEPKLATLSGEMNERTNKLPLGVKRKQIYCETVFQKSN